MINMKHAFLCCIIIASVYSCQSPTEISPAKSEKDNTDTSPPQRKNPMPGSMTDTTVYKNDTSIQKAATYLRSIFKKDLDRNLIDSASRKMFVEEVDLNNDGRNEMFVGLVGPYFCGSGGCTMILFDQVGKVLTRFTVVDYPVGIDSETTGGWKNLILESKDVPHLVKHNGKGYPSNPSLLPVYDLTKNKGMETIFVVYELNYAASF